MEPERKYVIDNVLPPLNEIIHIHCKLIKTPLVLDNNNLGEKFYSQIQGDKTIFKKKKIMKQMKIYQLIITLKLIVYVK